MAKNDKSSSSSKDDMDNIDLMKDLPDEQLRDIQRSLAESDEDMM